MLNDGLPFFALPRGLPYSSRGASAEVAFVPLSLSPVAFVGGPWVVLASGQDKVSGD